MDKEKYKEIYKEQVVHRNHIRRLVKLTDRESGRYVHMSYHTDGTVKCLDAPYQDKDTLLELMQKEREILFLWQENNRQMVTNFLSEHLWSEDDRIKLRRWQKHYHVVVTAITETHVLGRTADRAILSIERRRLFSEASRKGGCYECSETLV